MTFLQRIQGWLIGRGQSTISRQMLRALMITVISLLLLLDAVIYWFVFDRIYTNTTESIKQTLRVESSFLGQYLYRHMDDLCILRHLVDFSDPDKSFRELDRVLKDHGNPYKMYRLTLPDGTSYNSITGKDSLSAKDHIYYKTIMDNNWMCFESSRYCDVVGEDCYSLSLVVFNEYWMRLGIITVYFATDEIDSHLSKLRFNDTGSCLFIDGTGMVRRYSDDDPVSMHIDRFVEMGFSGIDTIFVNSFKRFEDSQLKAEDIGESEFSYQGTPIVVYYTMVPGMSKLALCTAIPKLLFYRDFYIILLLMVLITISIIFALLRMAKRLTNSLVTVPLEKVNQFTNDFADGNLYSSAIDDLESQNEILYLKENLKTMQTRVHDAVIKIRDYSQDISSDSKSLTSSISQVSDGAQTQSATVEQISVSVDSISDFIKDNADKAQVTSTNSTQISADIQTVTQASSQTLQCIQNVIDKAQVINEITHRTDILAVNAAVAASRAGEHGKAFAVVAEEIRKLSERCQQASVDINKSSAESLRITQTSASLINQISPRIQENAVKVAEISESCAEQLQKTIQIQQAIQQLVNITVVNSQSAEQLDIFSSRLTEKLKQLNICIDFFKLGDGAMSRDTIERLIEQHTQEIMLLNAQIESEIDDIMEKEKVRK